MHADFVGMSRAQERVLDDADLVAPLDTTVLLTGESGTGKELLARYIHGRSSRREGPYVTCDCAALSSSLCESELFGYRRGAFTGALRDSPGYMASSHGGTLFLDEVGDLAVGSQTRLLRFLEERTVVPLGEVRPRSLDVRVLAATNRPLDRLVADGRFREDLFHRLNVVNLHLQPLRERPEDVVPLCEHFRRSFALKHRKTVVGFTPQATQALERWHWPGNVREVRNAVERAVVLCRGTWIDRGDLPGAVIGRGEPSAERPLPEEEPSFAELTRRFQRQLLEEALEKAGGDRREAARRLKLAPHQLKYLVGKLGLTG